MLGEIHFETAKFYFFDLGVVISYWRSTANQEVDFILDDPEYPSHTRL
ncbi:MAG: hypothetical protein ABIJ86_08870 [Spirochaetota bacterium]